MRNRQLILCVLWGSLFLILFSSCRKHESFPVQIINHSGFDLTAFSFGCTVSSDVLSLNANDTSDIVPFSYERRFRLTPKLMCLFIADFDDLGNNYAHISSDHIPFSKKTVDHELNTIVITSEESGDTLYFRVEMN